MKPMLPALLTLLLAAPSQAAITSPYHLVPEDSILNGAEFASYEQKVVDAMPEAYDKGFQVRLIEEPSFQPELAVFLRDDGDGNGAGAGGHGWSIVALRPQVQLWTYKGPLDKVAVARCQVPIDAELAQRIKATWIAVLLDTHYVRDGEEGEMDSNGIEYHFAAFSDDSLGGWTNSPDPKGEAGRLVDIAESMIALCDGKTPALATAVKEQVDHLLSTFPSEMTP